MGQSQLPVAVIGAGPVGLAAAAHLVSNGETPLVFEAGHSAGASVLDWGHVRVFSPWKYDIDPVSAGLLESHGWARPDGDAYPTGREIVEQYLKPLAALPEIAPHVHYETGVTAVTRQGFDRMKTDGRDESPFLLRVQKADGSEQQFLASAVIDASGTYRLPNPLGTSGIPATGEQAASDRIFYGIPNVLNTHRQRYAGKRVLVIGGGHSAYNALIDLVYLAEEEPDTEIIWAVRSPEHRLSFGGGSNDMLPERGRLGERIRRQVEQGSIRLVTGFKTTAVTTTEDGIVVSSEQEMLPPVDEIIATTGFRPDLSMFGELRLRLDPAVEAPDTLAPLIDPNVHSCGSVRPHGAEELKHPERDFYIVGMKSYGRAPTFLLLTGYEQVRSVTAAITGDWESARRVELELPETGVCSTDLSHLDGQNGTATPEEAVPVAAGIAGCECG